MKYLLYTDVHWCTYSSIIRSIGEKYSIRLENLIKSVNWAEELAQEKNCDEIICLGDFFDKPDLTSQQITALNDLKWAKLPHSFIVGNHDASTKDLAFNSVNVLSNVGQIISGFRSEKIDTNTYFLYLPYIQDDIRLSIAEYKKILDIPQNAKVIVLSHNDVKGIQYGPIKTTIGIDLNDIENNCSLFLNGHVHNGSQICKNGFNLGNLSGKVFEEDAFKYKHQVVILEVINNEITIDFIENPFAFNFYKLDIKTENDLNKLNEIGNNAVISVNYLPAMKEKIQQFIDKSNSIIESKLNRIVEVGSVENETLLVKLNEMDYLEQFKTFSIAQLGDSKEVLDEINRILMA